MEQIILNSLNNKYLFALKKIAFELDLINFQKLKKKELINLILMKKLLDIKIYEFNALFYLDFHKDYKFLKLNNKDLESLIKKEFTIEKIIKLLDWIFSETEFIEIKILKHEKMKIKVNIKIKSIENFDWFKINTEKYDFQLSRNFNDAYIYLDKNNDDTAVCIISTKIKRIL